MIIEGFLLGFIAAASLASGFFFLRFYKETRDPLFLAFAAFFLIEASIRSVLLSFARPNEGGPWIYSVRLLGLLWILIAILRKNVAGRRS